MVGLCSDKLIVNWKYRKSKMQSVHLATEPHSSDQPPVNVPRAHTLAYSWAESSDTKPILE